MNLQEDDDRFIPRIEGLTHRDELCQSPACACDETRATRRCFVCGSSRCQHPSCSQILVRASGNVALCAEHWLCRTAYDMRERVAKGEVSRG